MLTVQYAKALPEIKFNAVEPCFTATDLTPASRAGQPVEKAAEVTGTYSEEARPLQW